MSDRFLRPIPTRQPEAIHQLHAGSNSNPNSIEQEVIRKFLFYNMPVDFFPENVVPSWLTGPGIVPLTDDVALTAIAMPITRRPVGPGGPSLAYLNPSDVFDNPELYTALLLNDPVPIRTSARILGSKLHRVDQYPQSVLPGSDPRAGHSAG